MASATVKERKKGISIDCRTILNIMVILGFMFNYMLRVNLTIAIVEMVHTPSATNSTTDTATDSTANYTTTASNLSDSKETNKFYWDKYQQNQALGCFFWGYLLTELPGGRIAELIGAKWVFGGGMLGASILTLLTPAACYLHVYVLVAVRCILGFCLGATWPSIPPMAAKWIPPMERSKFIANMMASSLGAAMTLPLCGYLISWFGWESVFYVTGGIGLVWSIAWFFLVYDSPAQHPRCSPEEREYLERKIAEAAGTGVKPSSAPWFKMVTSLPVWAIIITHACSVFGYFTVVNQLPTYMKEVLHYNVKENGLLSSLPYVGKYLMAVISSYVADRIRQSGRLTTTAIRKLFTTFAVATPAFFFTLQAIYGDIRSLSVAIFTLSLFFNGAVTAGYLANGLDIAPNFSGTIFGMANTLSSAGGWLSTTIVAAITSKNQTFEQWRWVFWILVGTYALGALAFLVFGTGKMQEWNSVKGAEVLGKELQPLRGEEKEEKEEKEKEVEKV